MKIKHRHNDKMMPNVRKKFESFMESELEKIRERSLNLREHDLRIDKRKQRKSVKSD